MMNEFFQHFDMQDMAAFAFFIATWAVYAQYTKRQAHRTSLLATVNRYRLQWMRQMLKRDNRSVDAIVIGNLMRSVTFSANTTILILAGLIGMLSHYGQIGNIFGAIPFAKPMSETVWEMKISLLILIFIYAYFKYTWSLRQQNYTSILVAAAPLETELGDEHDGYARKAAFLAGNAAEHFNYALRAYYFAMAAIAWFIHPYLFMLATLLVVAVLYRREFHSQTLNHLARDA